MAKPQWDEATEDRLRRLWEDKTRTVREIAEALGTTPLAVSVKRKRMGLPSRYPQQRRKTREPAT